MDLKWHMIIKGGKDITEDVVRCEYIKGEGKYKVAYKSGFVAQHNYSTICKMNDPIIIKPTDASISCNGKEYFDLADIRLFTDKQEAGTQYFRFWTKNGTVWSKPERELTVLKSCLQNKTAMNRLSYFKQLAQLNELSAEDGTLLLQKQYEKLDFVGEDTALAAYLHPETTSIRRYKNRHLIFPFGCNASQYHAVQKALSNQISVIQGPPGTGKTQTILNIISNLLMKGSSVLVVSNNNSATENVLEKLASKQYGMGFLVAPLGSGKNKKLFIQNQSGTYPDLSGWMLDDEKEAMLPEEIAACSSLLHSLYEKKERIARAQQELSALETEVKHFAHYCQETALDRERVHMRLALKSNRIMQLWLECFDFSDRERPLSFWFKVKSVLFYGVSDWAFFKKDISKIITLMQSLYYQTKLTELRDEIADLKKALEQGSLSELQQNLTLQSMEYLRGHLYSKYGNQSERVFFTDEVFWKTPQDLIAEYPIVLSTTFSSRSCLGKKMVYDYVIMDEASQVDITAGALALSCARNIVIVGDTKQLSNVVPLKTQALADAMWDAADIPEGYAFSRHSLLQSVCTVIPDVPQTLLREHYRCHPKIIGYCNQKFYNNELVIMTEDRDEQDVLMAFKTVPGNHKRGHFNQRQIDVIREEALPILDTESFGIIAPYNDQVHALTTQLECAGIDIATVHKFQGREKDGILFSTTDDVVTYFSDASDLINVSVSRAKNKFCLVVSGNEQPLGSNIGDLLSYIAYNNFSVVESETYSVFDYLYTQYTKERFAFLKKHKRISQFNSENLMYIMIKEILQDYYPSLGIVCHLPLNMIIRDSMHLDERDCQFAMNPNTHLDFLIYDRIGKKPVLAVEVDGFCFHHGNPEQITRDKMKDRILSLYHIQGIRFPTNGSGEREKLLAKLRELFAQDNQLKEQPINENW